MHMPTTTFKPDYIIPPGEILEEILETKGIKKKDFADRCGKTAKTISEIIAGKAPITAETALHFERVLNIPAQFWSNLESNYRLKIAEQEERQQLEALNHIPKNFPMRDLIKLGFLNQPTDPTDALDQLLNFFGVGTVEGLYPFPHAEAALFRESKAFESNQYSVATWLRCGQIRADNIETKTFNAEKFKECLAEIRKLTRETDIQFAITKTTQLCADAGVALVIIPEINGTRLCGAARWLTKDKALIQLSLRHKTDDQLWFTFFHEAAHILLHSKKDVFLDEEGQINNSLETEADTFSKNILIPKDAWSELTGWADFPENIIQDFAYKYGISPGIVVGRLQEGEKYLPYSSKQNKLKEIYEVNNTGMAIFKKIRK